MGQSEIPAEAKAGAKSVIVQLGAMKPGETVCVVSDAGTRELGVLLTQIANDSGGVAEHHVAPEVEMHGMEPPAEVAAAMRAAKLVVGIRSKSMAHTRARQQACQAGARYLSLPEYSLEMLMHPALRIDY